MSWKDALKIKFEEGRKIGEAKRKKKGGDNVQINEDVYKE